MPSSQGHTSGGAVSATPIIAAVVSPHPSLLQPGALQPWRAAAIPRPEDPARLPQSARCSERGCVFPAAAGKEGKCLHHLRQNHEPILFSSYQPTRAVLDRGRFELPAEEVDTSRSRDRRQLVAMREAFLED
ncbi:MAG: hypothetical protein KGM47_10785 [Acidobacteriota bacterium]|nr:hypothetical protein [Acidobacteriota bacterium]